MKNALLRELGDETIEIILDFVNLATSPFGMVAVRELGGAMARVPIDATAFAHRNKAFYVAADNSWEDDLRPERHIAWTEAFWEAVAPYTDGAYAGFLEDEGEDRVRAAYAPASYTRLAAIKRHYDPDNLFRMNPDIPRAMSSGRHRGLHRDDSSPTEGAFRERTRCFGLRDHRRRYASAGRS
jgi:FAD/FMN-containing dehydrogenase